MPTRRDVLLGASAFGLPAVLAAACSPAPRAASAPPSPAPPPSPSALASGRAAASRTILILGGTAFLGPELVEAARARGHKITLFNRGKTHPELFPDIEKLHGDRDGDLKALEGRRWDAVIDTSGYVPRIVKASADLLAPAVGQYLFVSSISVYPDGLPVGSDETHPVQPLTEPGSEEVKKHYGALKALCEKAVEAALPGRATNVRPGLIVGPGDPTDRFTYWPARLDRGGEVLAPGTGGDPAQVIDVRDLAAFMIGCVEEKHVGVFNAVGPKDPLTMRGMLDACQPPAPGQPARIAWVDAAFLDKQKVSPWTDLPVWTGDDRGMSSVKNHRALERGLRYRPLAETSRDTLAWWKKLPADRREKPRAGLGKEREAELLAAWKAQTAR